MALNTLDPAATHAGSAPRASASTNDKSPQAHLGYIDGLRALAALYVIAHHAEYYAPGEHLRWYEKWLPYGHFSVGVFITLSGYVLMLPVARHAMNLRGGVWGFYQRRARRILPTYYAALGVSVLLIALVIGQRTGTQWDVSVPITLKQVAAHLLLVQDIFQADGHTLDYPCWSIAVEWQIYLLFPLLIFCWKKLGAYGGAAVGLAAGFLFHHVFAKTILVESDPWYLGLFSLGMLGAWFSVSAEPKAQALRLRIPWGWISLAGLAGVIAFCLHYGPVQQGAHIATADYSVGIATASLLVAASLERNAGLRRVLGWPPLVFLGTYAYSIYLIHAPLLQLFWLYVVHPLHLSPNNQLLMMEFGGLPAAVAVAYPFFLLFERPFLVTRKNESAAQVAQDAAESPAP